ncbi:carbonic anhydrase [Desulfogranum marinum]|jgi:carbonic anhydrase|uniref:carbonic anhydrase n=1 Tax=Desulfogranum marinum TaxID=453220 RepID=UPI001963D258|nr:carbonic anhydrase [Desulfogranum marinum]MBM9511869.1 carbonic anhydrase [Desulfogranum marinum]
MEQIVTTRPTADEALSLLLEGNKRFISCSLEHPNHCEESRGRLVEGQEPIACILTCADSRVPPVDIFDQGLGDVFVLRVAGNIVNDQILGSIEYAVKHLHCPLVMVLGHTSCGAVGAVAGGTRLGGHIASLTPPIDAAIKNVQGKDGNLVNNASMELAKNMATKIEQSEPYVADLVKDGKVKVVASFYNLETGEVSMLD